MFLDTSYCIALMREWARGSEGPAVKKLRELGDTSLRISLFVACELEAGARMSDNPNQEIRKVERFMEHVDVILPDRSFAVAYGEMEALLRGKGRPIPSMDLMIGVTARMHGVPLLAGPDSHFKQIPGLVLEIF